jgi:hypothetical protein
VRSLTLDDSFAKHAIPSCKLLKMDCESAEHEILPATSAIAAVERFSAELHINEALRVRGCSLEKLSALVAQNIRSDRIAIHGIRMGE